MNRETSVTWTWQDVNSLRPDWSQEHCEFALSRISKVLKESLTTQGWEIMSDLILIMEMGNK
jgi:hypothetical protein